MKGLENKLDGVHVGDLIILESAQLEAGGYVIDFNPRQVKLSHENPFSNESHKFMTIHRTVFSAGDRNYNLKYFDSYKILKKYEPPKEE